MTELTLGLAQAPRSDDALLMHGRRSELLRYGLVVVAVIFAFGVRFALSPLLEDQAPYLFFVPALLIAAGLGGLGQGLVATGLSLPLALFFIVQHRAIGWPDSVNGVAFIAIGFSAAWVGERLHRARLWASTREAHLRSILATLTRRNDCHRRTRDCPRIQCCSRAAVRLLRRRDHRKKCRHADASASS